MVRILLGLTLLVALAAACGDNELPNFCGNGRLEGDLGERCDPMIAAGLPGACPVSCNDNNPCTTDTISGEKDLCTATCTNTVDTTLVGCLSTCGNGVVDKDETCDTSIADGKEGACPTKCDDAKPCTEDVLEGRGCAAKCTATDITLTASTADSCCPTGGNANTDPDCAASCGNKVLEGGEACDTGITDGTVVDGKCPKVSDCNDDKACTTDSVAGADCAQKCAHADVVTAKNSDQCCPAAAHSENDNDCKPVCGNAVVEEAAGEECDPGITTGAGKCPANIDDCDDQKSCTDDSFNSAQGCAAACGHIDIENCSGTTKDGCCAPGCDNNTDKDCSANCGNGVVEKGDGEECDKTIVSPAEGFCPTDAAVDCDDKDPCTADTIDGTTAACTAKCIHSAIGASTVAKDLCCPKGANNNTDSDCKAVCDNGVFEPGGGETCDDGVDSTKPCPVITACDDKNACTNDTLPEGTKDNACTVACKNTAFEPCCGDAKVTAGSESCDTLITGGATGDCANITCVDAYTCTVDTPIEPGGNKCAKICAHTDVADATNSDNCCPPTASFATDKDCLCGSTTIEATLGETCDPASTTCTSSCTTGDGSVIGSPCAVTDPAKLHGSCTLGTPFDGQAGTLCILPTSFPGLTDGFVNGYCTSVGCDPSPTDSTNDVDVIPENIDSCPGNADPTKPKSICVQLPGAPLTTCAAVCNTLQKLGSSGGGDGACRHAEKDATGSYAYVCTEVDPTTHVGICVARDPRK
jgi:hypothetical protein